MHCPVRPQKCNRLFRKTFEQVSQIVSLKFEVCDRPIIAFGPRMPGYGSWDWVGSDIAESLGSRWDVQIFDDEIPACDLVVFVKFKPAANVLRQIASGSAIIYCPIDFYGSAAEIDADASSLLVCDRVLIHCERLRKYFAPYAAVEYMDHHVKFSASLRREFVTRGPLLWVGVRSNLLPLVEFVNANRFPEELWILTNPEDPTAVPSPAQYGFRSDRPVRIGCWTPERQREWTSVCRGALDVKARDFRSCHKPPAKGIDFIASGVPLAIESNSSTAEHLGRMGLDSATPDDLDRWLSRDYWDETVRFGAAIGELLSRKRVVRRFERVIEQLLAGRRF